jgi:hypothetical protein
MIPIPNKAKIMMITINENGMAPVLVLLFFLIGLFVRDRIFLAVVAEALAGGDVVVVLRARIMITIIDRQRKPMLLYCRGSVVCLLFLLSAIIMCRREARFSVQRVMSIIVRMLRRNKQEAVFLILQ